MAWNRFDWDAPQTWPPYNRLVYAWGVELHDGERDEESIVIKVVALMEDDCSWWGTDGRPVDVDAWDPLAHPITRDDKPPVEIWWHELPELPDGRR